jgi:hypothetical protein
MRVAEDLIFGFQSLVHFGMPFAAFYRRTGLIPVFAAEIGSSHARIGRNALLSMVRFAQLDAASIRTASSHGQLT